MGENAGGKYPPAHELLTRCILNPGESISDKAFAARMLGSMAIPKEAARDIVRSLCVGFLLDEDPDSEGFFVGMIGSAIQHVSSTAGAPFDLIMIRNLVSLKNAIVSIPSGKDDKDAGGEANVDDEDEQEHRGGDEDSRFHLASV